MIIGFLEDDLLTQDLLSSLFAIEQIQSINLTGYDLAEICHSIANKNIDALLIDVHLTGVSGLEITQHIRSKPQNENLVIVMTSGKPLQEECLHAGANRFFMKPFSSTELISYLHTSFASH